MDKLKLWIKTYLENKDIINNEIKKISDKDNSIIVEYENYSKEFIVEPNLEKIDLNKNIGIVFMNNKENLDQVIKKWTQLKKNENIIIYFVNPEIDQKWIIKPYIHSKIADQSTLKKGLKAMAESIQPC